MTIRDAAESDLPAIVEIFNATIPAHLSTAVLEPVTVAERLPRFQEHSPDQYPLWILELDGELAGWLSFHPFIPRGAYRPTAEVSVYVHENFRRRGVARALLDQAIARSPALGLTALVGLILGPNAASLALFEQLGFERWGLLPRVTRFADVERDLVIVGRSCENKAPKTPGQPGDYRLSDSWEDFDSILGDALKRPMSASFPATGVA
jgi:phosphinothricin acetyltransferase